MADTPTIAMRLDPEFNRQANQILESLSLTMTGVIAIFLKAVRVLGIPFNMKVSNGVSIEEK